MSKIEITIYNTKHYVLMNGIHYIIISKELNLLRCVNPKVGRYLYLRDIHVYGEYANMFCTYDMRTYMLYIIAFLY